MRKEEEEGRNEGVRGKRTLFGMSKQWQVL